MLNGCTRTSYLFDSLLYIFIITFFRLNLVSFQKLDEFYIVFEIYLKKKTKL